MSTDDEYITVCQTCVQPHKAFRTYCPHCGDLSGLTKNCLLVAVLLLCGGVLSAMLAAAVALLAVA